MTKDDALKLALEALEASQLLVHGNETKGGLVYCMDGYYSGCFDIDSNDKQTNEAISAIKEVLTQGIKMRNEDIQKEIDRMTNNRMDSIGTMEEQKEFDNKRNYVMIEKLIADVVTQLDKDPIDQMVDTETIIREFVKKIMQEKQ